MRSSRYLLLLPLLLAACTSAIQPTPQALATTMPATTSVAPTPTVPPSPEPTSVVEPTSTALAEPSPDPPPRGAELEFDTDFSQHSVPYSEIFSGGPPKDGIPAIDHPVFVPVDEADGWLDGMEPVIFVQVGEEARAYPVQIVIWHEIVNDQVGEVPLVITFCPLCNTGIAFERQVGGMRLDFGTTGRLRFSNLIMYDRQTETWWQQADGQAIAGELTGQRLAFYPVAMVSWEDFKSGHPDGLVLSRETGHIRPYGSNPYVGYDDVRQSPFLYRGPQTPDALPAVARVLTIDMNGEAVAYPYDVLEELRVVNDEVGGEPVAVFWVPGTASALDRAFIPDGRDTGSASAFSRRTGDEPLTFAVRDGAIVDEGTGSSWNILGVATDGPLAGTSLEPLVSINHFWFSWAAFRPETSIYHP